MCLCHVVLLVLFFSLEEKGRLTEEKGHAQLFSSGFMWVQMVKYLPVMRDTQVWSLGGDDPLEKGMATHSSIPALRIPWTKGAWWGWIGILILRINEQWIKQYDHWKCRSNCVYCVVLKKASLVAQLVKNPPVMLETWVLSLGWEDALEKGMATHSSILAWRIPWTV